MITSQPIRMIIVFMGIMLAAGLCFIAPASAADSVELKVAYGFPESDAFCKHASAWMAAVTEKTEGRVKFTPFYAGSLVPLPEILDAVREGSADLGLIVASFTSGKVPGLSAFEGIGACPMDIGKFNEMLGKIEPVVNSMFEEQGLVYMFLQPAPGNDAVSSKSCLQNFEQFKGLKIRHSGRWGQVQMQLIGVNCVVIPPGDVYQALQTGVVDAALGTNSLTLQFKWHEVAPFVTDFNLIGNTNFMIANKKVWERISSEDQKIVIEVSKEFSRSSLTQIAKSQKEALQTLADQGATTYAWNAEEQAGFQKATADLWNQVKKGSGPFGAKLVEIMDEYRQ